MTKKEKELLIQKLVPFITRLSEHSSDSANKRKVVMAKATLESIISEVEREVK